ncbi:helix-turn-helix domain-containing protein [Bifidobacterium sp. ESL0728]|uniref:helix-turn-helix domain-containing protein n=1 Tax=Bifidobacterium sp. ESL0728 TaxID=2983220 RepID=UPI0023F6F8FB|nr:helix-turn-helix domain-containing protein [Bifidobacterium sp. ESL0728]WEV59702.1 helix-turn-helix domain-containing protein [Bifidobacterium sp. ESL0728]
MSYQASSWALRHAPVGSDTTKRLILMALAEFAGPDGTGAYPAIDTLCDLVRLKRRCVLRHIAEMERSGVIRRGDQRLTLHYRADRRPVVWDLNMPATGKSGMPVAQEHAIEHSLADDVHADAPRGDGSDEKNDMHQRAPRATSGVHADAPRQIRRGARTGTNGVHRRAPKPLDKPLLPPVVPQGDPQQMESKQVKHPSTTLPDGWEPTEAHRIYALEHGVDLDHSAKRFRENMTGNGTKSRAWNQKFQAWLENDSIYNLMHDNGAKNKQDGADETEAPKNHTHSWKCEHVLGLLRRDEEGSEPDGLACRLAELLNNGESGHEALKELGLPAGYEGLEEA